MTPPGKAVGEGRRLSKVIRGLILHNWRLLLQQIVQQQHRLRGVPDPSQFNRRDIIGRLDELGVHGHGEEGELRAQGFGKWRARRLGQAALRSARPNTWRHVVECWVAQVQGLTQPTEATPLTPPVRPQLTIGHSSSAAPA